MREPSSEGIFRTGTLGYIRFFWPFNHIGFEDFLIEEVLSPFFVASHFNAMHALPISLLHLLIFAANLFSRAVGEIGLDESEVSSIKFNELILLGFTS